MSYKAITIDTSSLERKGFRFENGLLKKLEQFDKKPISLVISEIVGREVLKHLTEKNAEVKIQSDKTVKLIKERYQYTDKDLGELKRIISPSKSNEDIAKQRFKKFLDNTGAEIIKVNGRINLDDLIAKYFNSEPPFSAKGTKKNEFPDALALISLEHWASEMDKKILAVSSDSDWQSFGDTSKHIDVIEDLGEALAIFQPTSDATKFCKILSTNLGTIKTKNIATFIDSSLKKAVPELEVSVEADSYYFFEPDIPELTYKSFDFVRDINRNIIIRPIQTQDKLLAIEMKIRVYITAKCNFSFSKYDSIDKEYIDIGDGEYEISHDFTTEVIFLINGDFKKDISNLTCSDFEIVQEPITINFDEVEPIWNEV